MRVHVFRRTDRRNQKSGKREVVGTSLEAFLFQGGSRNSRLSKGLEENGPNWTLTEILKALPPDTLRQLIESKMSEGTPTGTPSTHS